MKLFRKKEKKIDVGSPVKGKVIALSETKDPVFNTGSLGKGVGILPEGKTIYAPVSGRIETFYPTRHAIGIKTKDGLEVLIHIGIDTVELEGKYFTARKVQGDHVSTQDPLVDVDFNGIEGEGYDPTIFVVITNSKEYRNIKTYLGPKDEGETMIEVEE